MRVRRAAVAAVLLLAAFAAPGTRSVRAAEDGPPAFRVTHGQAIEAGMRVALHRVLDVDRDGSDDLLVVSREGAVRVWKGTEAGFAPEPAGVLQLAHPAHSLLTVGDVLCDGSPPQLVVLSPAGLIAHPVGEDGAYRRGGQVLAKRAKLGLRVSEPRFSDILRDVNGDGRPDLLVPCADSCELWLNDGPDDAATNGNPGLPRFRKAAVFRVKTTRHRSTAQGALSDLLEESFRVPALRFSDVNGDGREDLLVGDRKRQAFHMQAADGTFPADPDVEVDLKIFRDTTPAGEVRPGGTLSGERDARLETSDLNQDGIPDYVIAHRRKVWVFHGTTAGPQFTEPTAVLKTAEDVTALLVTHLDDDGRPDLLLMRLRIPSIGTVLGGLFAEWEVDLSFAGYANGDGRNFGRKPRWRSEVALRLPAIVGVLRDVESFVQRFDDALNAFRPIAVGDLDADGRPDLAMVGEDESDVKVWRGTGEAAKTQAAGELSRLIFEEADQVWELDRIFQWFGQLGRRQAAVLTGGRDPDRRLALRPAEEFERTGVQCGKRPGPGVLVVAYRRLDTDGHGVFDVYRLEQ